MSRRSSKVIIKKLLFILIPVIFVQSCSMNKFVIRQTGTIIEYGVAALYEETDLTIAEQALASNIKLLEGMIKGDPENEDLLLLTSQAFSGYTMGFVEDEEPERAKSLYLRGKEYGLKVLRMDDLFAQNEAATLDEFTMVVNQLDDEYLEAIFWTAFAWGSWINLSLDNPKALMELPRVEALMQRVLDLDESLFSWRSRSVLWQYLGNQTQNAWWRSGKSPSVF